MSAPVGLDYQTPPNRTRRMCSSPSALAVCCVIAQAPWLLLWAFAAVMMRDGRRIELVIDTAVYVFGWVPTLAAITLAIRAICSRASTRVGRAVGIAVLLVCGVFLWWQVPYWWRDIVHAAPGARWEFP